MHSDMVSSVMSFAVNGDDWWDDEVWRKYLHFGLN